MAAQWAMNWWSDRRAWLASARLAWTVSESVVRSNSGCRTRGGRGDLKWILTPSFGLNLDVLNFENNGFVIYGSLDKQADLAKNGIREERSTG
jgi:hypothetical protein